MSDSPDLRSRIDGALAFLKTREAGDPVRAKRSLEFAVSLLEETRAALDRRDRELEVMTDPGVEASRRVVALQKQLERNEERVLELELALSAAHAEVQALEALSTEDQLTRRELERRVAATERKLMTDDDAFAQFMDAALDEQEDAERRRHGGPGPL